MPSGNNSVYGPANRPMFDPAGERGVRKRYLKANLSEIVFGYDGPVDTVDQSGPWAAPQPVQFYEIVLCAGVAGSGAVTVRITTPSGNTNFVIGGGVTEVVHATSLQVAHNGLVRCAVTSVAANMENLNVICRYQAYIAAAVP